MSSPLLDEHSKQSDLKPHHLYVLLTVRDAESLLRLHLESL